jgi:hypothetical protein
MTFGPSRVTSKNFSNTAFTNDGDMGRKHELVSIAGPRYRDSGGRTTANEPIEISDLSAKLPLPQRRESTCLNSS